MFMNYLHTFTIDLSQMQVNIPYMEIMEHLGVNIFNKLTSPIECLGLKKKDTH